MTSIPSADRSSLTPPIRASSSPRQILPTRKTASSGGFTYRTQDQIEEWLNDLRILLQTNESYAEAGYWPMNDTACDKFGGCRFRGICSKTPDAREMFSKPISPNQRSPERCPLEAGKSP